MIASSRAVWLAAALALSGVACVGAPPKLPLMADVERARSSPAATEAAKLAPQAFAEADAERAFAKQEQDKGDDVAASLHAERAIAAYQRAAMAARAVRATSELASAQGELAQKTQELHGLEAARADAERQGDELQKRLAIAKELHAPAAAGPADPQREAARLVASRALATQARLLCGAAKLVSPSGVSGLTEAAAQLDALEKRLEGAPKSAPIDDAAKVRATCLALLTQARHAAQGAGTPTTPDGLLAELSAAGSSPSRDERGVVVTLREVFRGAQLAPEASQKLEALGRVAASHADVGVQVVVHDAVAQSGGDERGKAVEAALVKGGAKADRVTHVMAGTRAPVVDPADARNRGRNARVEIVFVTVGN